LLYSARVIFCKASGIGDIAIPRKIVILKVMPQLSTGKIDYAVLKAAFPETI
jgi:acyl-coenzyme A synthetase/AMP-(fatty) acid ligase